MRGTARLGDERGNLHRLVVGIPADRAAISERELQRFDQQMQRFRPVVRQPRQVEPLQDVERLYHVQPGRGRRGDDDSVASVRALDRVPPDDSITAQIVVLDRRAAVCAIFDDHVGRRTVVEPGVAVPRDPAKRLRKRGLAKALAGFGDRSAAAAHDLHRRREASELARVARERGAEVFVDREAFLRQPDRRFEQRAKGQTAEALRRLGPRGRGSRYRARHDTDVPALRRLLAKGARVGAAVHAEVLTDTLAADRLRTDRIPVQMMEPSGLRDVDQPGGVTRDARPIRA
jgi:hypothetical protein